MRRKLVFTKANSEDIMEVPDKLLEAKIKNTFDFEIGYVPEKYNIAFLLIKDDKKDSRNDVWKTVFFKQARKLNGTITLDNIEQFNESAEREYEIFKVIDGNYENIINISVDVIKKYREENESKV